MTTTSTKAAHQNFSVFAAQAFQRVERGDVPEWLREMFLAGDPPWIATILSDHGVPDSAMFELLSIAWAFHAFLSAANPTPGSLSLREIREYQRRLEEFDEFLAKLKANGIGLESFGAPPGLGGEPTFVIHDKTTGMRDDLQSMLRQLSEIPIKNGRPLEFRGAAFIQLDQALNAAGLNFDVPELTNLGSDLFDGILEGNSEGSFNDLPRGRDFARAAKISNGTLRKTRRK